MKISLVGKVALVTGAGSGIGRGVAQVLAKVGAHVVAVDVNAATAKETAERITRDGGKATGLAGDVSSDASMIGVMERVAKDLGGGLHVLVNNAGVELFKGIQDTSYTDWDKIVDVDLKGVFISTKAGLPLLKKAGGSGGAYIVNIASVHAHATVPNLTAYAAAKGGVVGMTRSLSMELGPLGIRVNSISPGFVDTPMVQRWLNSMPNPQAELERVHKLHAVPRIGTPEDIGQMIAFLASGYADFVVGANLTIDGGLTNRLQH
ncbi:MAG: SDR family oxidoreductase [Planctomycetes bacterium]|nr:SDR family oxidoreductase [Planctomycetota bacterium]